MMLVSYYITEYIISIISYIIFRSAGIISTSVEVEVFIDCGPVVLYHRTTKYEVGKKYFV